MRTSPTGLRSRLFDVAADQGGYFTAAQARDVGYSYQAQAHHVAAGNWLRIDRGIFRLARVGARPPRRPRPLEPMGS